MLITKNEVIFEKIPKDEWNWLFSPDILQKWTISHDDFFLTSKWKLNSPVTWKMSKIKMRIMPEG